MARLLHESHQEPIILLCAIVGALLGFFLAWYLSVLW